MIAAQNVVQLWLPSHIREHNLEPEIRDRVSGTEFEAMALVLCLGRFVRLQLIEQYDDRPNTRFLSQCLYAVGVCAHRRE